MHTHDLSRWAHQHDFTDETAAAERGTRWVVAITASMMVVEIAAGWWFGSMALLADGWHMSSHALAIGLSLAAYAAARRYAHDRRFAFGTWKIEVLGGFASAVLLLAVATMMIFGSVERLFSPREIAYQEALVVAVVGLLVNAVCGLILHRAEGHHHHDDDGHHGHHHDDHEHHHDHTEAGHGHAHATVHHHPHHDHGRDLNLRAAYLHVMTDALTSVFAILALAGGWRFGWNWLDPLMGIVGGVLVALWSRGLLRDTSRVLLDREMDHPLVEAVQDTLESAHAGGETRVTDLHLWRVSRGRYACALSLVTHDHGLTAEGIRQTLGRHPEIAHATIELHYCEDTDEALAHAH